METTVETWGRIRRENVAGSRLVELRHKLALTQIELASKVSVLHGHVISQGDIGNYERGVKLMDYPRAMTIGSFFGVTPEYLLGLD
jgi:transcriptional regulator with XRE-family HTH domain